MIIYVRRGNWLKRFFVIASSEVQLAYALKEISSLSCKFTGIQTEFIKQIRDIFKKYKATIP